VVALLVVLLATVFGSPDERQVTIKSWSTAMPLDFATTAINEMNGSAGVAGYGPPYNHASTGQHIGFLHLAQWVGVRIPLNPTKDFVVAPLESQAPSATLTPALETWNSANATQKAAWVAAVTKVDPKMTFANGHLALPSADDGPLPVMLDSLTSMARSGALDQALVTGHGFYTTDYTKVLLFLADGSYLAGLAQHQHLTGSQWGMMNETGSYPGQAWLWLYTFWYQVPPFSSSSNADALVWGVMMVLSVGLICVPFIPGVRSLPRKLKLYRVIWREHYRAQG
ncbi:MAG TPA: cytochrome B6, partial [Acidimicrobiales bacterium]|nr:cytochrome B6 [Acidimicrobiales bacterium]